MLVPGASAGRLPGSTGRPHGSPASSISTGSDGPTRSRGTHADLRQVLHRRRVGRAGRLRHPRGALADHRRGHRLGAGGDHRRHGPRRRRRPRRLRGRVVDLDPGRARRAASLRISDGIKQRQDEFANLIIGEIGAPYYFAMFGQVLAATMVLDAFVEPHQGLPVRGAPRRRPRRPDPRAPRAGRRLRRHHPVERAAVHHRAEARPRRSPSGSHRSCSSPRRRRPLDAYLLRRGRSTRPALPAGVVNIVARRPRGRRAPRAPPRRRQGQLHRLHRRRPQDRRHLRRAAQALHARARRQVGRDHPRRRRPRRRPSGQLIGAGAHEQRPGLRRADPHPRARERATTRSSTRSPPRSAR